MRDCDRVWNRAALDSGGTAPRRGDHALADALAAHGLVMNGGVLHALEVLTPDQVRRAASGLEYLGLAQASRVLLETLEASIRFGDSEELEVQSNERYWAVVPDDSTLAARFEQVFAERPEDFASPGNP